MAKPQAPYILSSVTELDRLERQAAVYEIDSEVTRLRVPDGATVLDVGCGSGSMARAIARRHRDTAVLGVDADASLIAGAAALAASEGLDNVTFSVGTVTALPFEDEHFDVVWSKHLLQFIADRRAAVGEMCRVTRPGGRVVARNFDHFLVDCYPSDPVLQPDLERFFIDVLGTTGFDPRVGRMLPALFHEAGLQEVDVQVETDAMYGGIGPLGPEREWIYAAQMAAVAPLAAPLFDGDEAKTADFWRRALAYWSRPDIYRAAILLWIEGTRR